ncbi:MAG: hypothetical protein V8T86_12920 [Victivallis sp.]
MQVPRPGKTAEVEFELEVGNDFKANYGSSESLLVADHRLRSARRGRGISSFRSTPP